MIRGGHVGVAVLGALQVDARGRVANWAVPGRPILGVGGAMDLLVGARHVIVATTHVTKAGEPKLVQECTLPLTARAAGRPDRHRARDVRGARRRARARRGRAGHVARVRRRAHGRRLPGGAMTEALIIDGVRTPFGRHGGGLAPVRPDDLAAHVIRTLLERTGRTRRRRRGRAARLRQPGRRGQPQRRAHGGAAGRAPESVGGVTVNRLCGSGMDAVASAARGSGSARRRLRRRRRRVDEPRAVRRAQARARVPDRARRDGRHDARLAAREPAHGGAGPHRLARPDRGEPRRRARHRARRAGPLRARSHAKAVAAPDAGRFDAELVAVDVPGARRPRPSTPTRCRGATRRSRGSRSCDRRSCATAA